MTPDRKLPGRSEGSGRALNGTPGGPSPEVPACHAAPSSSPAGDGAALAVVAQFVIEGEPVSKERPRVTGRGTYTPAKTLKAEEVVGWQFRRAAPRHKPGPDGSYGVTALFFSARPAGRDVDNMLKLVLDGLNKVAWADDVQVTEVSARKLPALPGKARTEVVVYEAVAGALDGAA